MARNNYASMIGLKNHGYIIVAVREYMDVIDVLAVRGTEWGTEWVIGFIAEHDTTDNTVCWGYGHYYDSIEDALGDWVL